MNILIKRKQAGVPYIVKVLAFVALIVGMTSLPAFSQGQFEDWRLKCTETACSLHQDIAQTGSDKIQLRMSIVRREGQYVAIFVVPLGINLPAGLSIQVDDGRSNKRPFGTCTVQGCFVAMPFDAGTLSAWKRGLEAKVSYQDGSNEQIVSALSLQGITAGFEFLE